MIEQEINAFYTYLQSQQTAQQFLFNSYQYKNLEKAELKSYENYHSFLYYLEHGKQFYESGHKAPVVVKPILFFYGMVHLIKACLLTTRPDYPESTKILAHGVSARKRKKKDYTFMNDEVKIQYNGLFPYFSKHLFSLENFEKDRMQMEYLLSFIPELQPLFQFRNEKNLVKIGCTKSSRLSFPIQVLDGYHINANMFIKRLEPFTPNILKSNINDSVIQIEMDDPITQSSGPFFIHFDNQSIFFPTHRDRFFPISEVMIHYLLLYNLSMLSRYEAEWWGDLLATKPDYDYPFIIDFLNITSKKVPMLLGQLLYRDYLDHSPI